MDFQPKPVDKGKKQPKEFAMKRYLLLLPMLLTAAVGSAQNLNAEHYNFKDGVQDVTGPVGFSRLLTGTTAVSVTVPSYAHCFKVENNTAAWTCSDYAGNRFCGTAHPVASQNTNGWEYNSPYSKPLPHRVKAVQNVLPDTLWLQTDTSNSLVLGHWYVCP